MIKLFISLKNEVALFFNTLTKQPRSLLILPLRRTTILAVGILAVLILALSGAILLTNKQYSDKNTYSPSPTAPPSPTITLTPSQTISLTPTLSYSPTTKPQQSSSTNPSPTSTPNTSAATSATSTPTPVTSETGTINGYYYFSDNKDPVPSEGFRTDLMKITTYINDTNYSGESIGTINDSPNWSFTNLKPGKYSIGVWPTPWKNVTETSCENCSLQYGGSSARTVDLKAGDNLKTRWGFSR